MATLVYASGYAPIHVQKIGRNDPCPCGSGKKAKNCCGNKPKCFYLKSKKPEK